MTTSDLLNSTQPSGQHNELVGAPATPANVYDSLIDGANSTAAPSQMTAALLHLAPHLTQALQSNRTFLKRAITFLSHQGIDQFLDIGAGMLTTGSIHEIAQGINPMARIVYVEIDPVAVEHGQSYLRGNPYTSILQADFRNPERILTHPDTQRLLDFTRPVGLSMLCLLHFIIHDSEAYPVVQQLIEQLAPGSYVAISHGSIVEQNVAMFNRAVEMYSQMVKPLQSREAQEITRFFSGLTLVEPGLVWAPQWRPDGTEPPFADPTDALILSGVAYKPKD